MPKFIISLDLGTTNLKSALFDSELNLISSAQIPLEYIVNDDNEFIEFDPVFFYKLIVKLINKTCKEANLNTSDIDIISITSQANTFLIMSKNGEVRSNFVSYLDGRAVKEANILNGKFRKDFNFHFSFYKATENLLISKLLWFKNNKANLITKDSTFASLPGYVAYKLTSVNSIDVNIAAMEGFYSIKDKIWRQDLADFIGMNYKNFPKIINIGNYIISEKENVDFCLNKNLKVFLTGNDQTVGAFGTSLNKNEIILGLGTSLVVYKNHGNVSGPYNQNTGWGLYPFEGFYELYASNCGSYSLDITMEKLIGKKDIDYFKDLAKDSVFFKNREKIKDNEQLFFYPDKINYKSPWYGENDNLGDKAFSVFEGLSFFIKYILYELFKFRNDSDFIYVNGGGSRNEIWLQLIANILNLKIVKAKGSSLAGSAKIALKSLGIEKDFPDQKKEESVYPEKNKIKIYKDLYELWIKHK